MISDSVAMEQPVRVPFDMQTVQNNFKPPMQLVSNHTFKPSVGTILSITDLTAFI